MSNNVYNSSMYVWYTSSVPENAQGIKSDLFRIFPYQEIDQQFFEKEKHYDPIVKVFNTLWHSYCNVSFK